MPTRSEILKQLPKCLGDRYDIYSDKTPADFASLAEEEIEQYEDGEETGIANDEDLRAVRKFLEWCRSFETEDQS